MKKFHIEDLLVPIPAIFLLFTLLWNRIIEKTLLSLHIYDTYFVADGGSLAWLFFIASIILFIAYKLIRKKHRFVQYWLSSIHIYCSLGLMAALLYFSAADYFSPTPRRYIQIIDDRTNYLQLATALATLMFVALQIFFYYIFSGK
jgi:hypothetical protein